MKIIFHTTIVTLLFLLDVKTEYHWVKHIKLLFSYSRNNVVVTHFREIWYEKF